uniref:Uncharacterized protein LOC111110996 isoform X2 n=1 Tax=Crassostrea virginica TaxID=6565 RepID=A0A8B8BKC2_CRAVI|nr:uncharacterized protein LOC111110996 isoform X2 [Crassostrea virginica]
MAAGAHLNIFLYWTLISSIVLLKDCIAVKLDNISAYNTSSCPKNESEWKKRSDALKCNKTNSYMCLADDTLSELLEFCISFHPIGIRQGLCLLLHNRSNVVMYECRDFTEGCPDEHYFSNELFKYPSCMVIQNGCFVAEHSCLSTTFPNSTASADKTETTDDLTTWQQNDPKWNIVTSVVFVITASLLNIAVFIVIKCYVVKFMKKERHIGISIHTSLYHEEATHLSMSHEKGHDIYKEYGKLSTHSSVSLLVREPEKEKPPTTSFEEDGEDKNLVYESSSTNFNKSVSSDNESEMLSEDDTSLCQEKRSSITKKGSKCQLL